MIQINKVYFIGLAKGLKPKIILEVLLQMPIWKEKEFVLITDSKEGVTVEFCKNNDIEIIIIDKQDMISSINKIKEFNPYLLVSIGWNRKIPNEFLKVFKKCINCHSGLLPDYRGDKAYMHSYANIAEEYGTTIHVMNCEFDDGKIIIQGKLKLYLDETPEVMHRRISEITAMLIPEAIRLLEIGFEGIKQSGNARYFFKITREEMDLLRHRNTENIRKGFPKEIAPHKTWVL